MTIIFTRVVFANVWGGDFNILMTKITTEMSLHTFGYTWPHNEAPKCPPSLHVNRLYVQPVQNVARLYLGDYNIRLHVVYFNVYGIVAQMVPHNCLF